MPADIIVCVKQVPHPDYLARIPFDPETGAVNREGVPAVINPGDRNALEAALNIRERLSGRITVLTAGPPPARKALEEALAMGADTAVHLCDPAFAGADTLATAQTLAYGIGRLERFDLILCGDTTVDSGTGQVAVQLAEFLDLPAITNVAELTFEDEQKEPSLLVKRIWERGYISARIKLPAVISVTNKINQPRLPNIPGIMAATRKEIKCWNMADVGGDAGCVGLSGSPTRFFQTGEFHAKRHGEILQGPPDEVVDMAIARLVKLEAL